MGQVFEMSRDGIRNEVSPSDKPFRIPEQIALLLESLGRLAEVTVHLDSRLQPILRSNPPTESSDCLKADDMPSLARDISIARNRVDEQVDILTSIIQRLEL